MIGQPADRIHDFRAPAVTQRHREVQLVTVGGFPFHFFDPCEGGFREAVHAADGAKTGPLLDQRFHFHLEVPFQEHH